MFFEALNEMKISDPRQAEELYIKYQKQRLHFFNRRIIELTNIYQLTEQEKKSIWGLLLSAEQQPNSDTESISIRLLPELGSLNNQDELIDDSIESFSFLGLLKLYWSQAWREFTEQNKARLAARYVLKNQKENCKDQVAQISIAEDELSTEVEINLSKASKNLNLLPSLKLANEVDKNGILYLDNHALNYFKQHNIGPASKATIKHFKNIIENPDYCAKQRLAIWSSPLFFEKMVAACRWLDLTKRYVQNKKENPPALPFHFAVQVNQITTKGVKINSEHSQILSSSGKIISAFDCSAYIPLVTAESLLNTDISVLSSLSAKRIMPWSLIEVYKQHTLNIKTPNSIIIDGGFYTLGEIIGCGTKSKAIVTMKKIISLYSACSYEYNDGNNRVTGSLMMYEFIESKRNQSQKLILTLARALCPGFVNEISAGDSRYHQDKMLVPVLGKEPIFVGKRNEWGSQLNFINKFVIETRQRSIELYKRGGILLSDDNWKQIAKAARMPIELIPKVLDCWTAENYLEETDDCVFNLGSRYVNERDMLKESGEITYKGSLAGKIKKASSRKKFMSPKTFSRS